MKLYFFALIVIGTTKANNVPKNIPCPPPNKLPQAVHTGWTETGANYYPIGDRRTELIMTEMLEGNSRKSLEQFRASACPRAKHLNATLVNESGFGNTIQYNCVPNSVSNWQLFCTYLGANQNWSHQVYVTLTDYKTFGVSTRCYNNNVYTWTAFATVPVLSADVINKIKAHVKSLGFDENEALPISYPKTCPTVI